MNKTCTLAGLLVLCVASSIWAQKKGKDKEPKFGDVEAWEWELKSWNKDTTVGAIYLVDNASYEFNIQYTGGKDLFKYTVHRRIKILNSAAADGLSNISINYSPLFESFTRLKAHTLERLANGDVIKHELEDKNIIDEKSVKASGTLLQRTKRFSLPNVKPGSVIELTYTLVSLAINPRGWQFQAIYPKIRSVFSVSYPTAILTNETFYGDLQRMQKTEEKVGSTSLGYNTFDIFKTIYRIDSVPAFGEFRYLYSVANYLSSVYVDVTDVRIGLTNENNLVNSWFKISRDLQKSKNYFNEDENGESIVKETAELLRDPDTVKTIRNVYEYIHKEIKTMRFSDIKSIYEFPTTVRAAIKQKQAPDSLKCAIGLRLLSVLGYDPAVAFIRSRSNGFIQRKNPTLSQFDHLVIIVSTGKGDYVLDISDEALPFNMLPKSYFNREMWLVTAKEDEFVALPMLFSDDHSIAVNGKLSADGTLTAEFSARYTGYGASDARAVWRKSGSQNWLQKQIFDDQLQVKVTDASTDTTTAIEEPVLAQGKLTLPGFAQVIDGELYFNPMLADRERENPLKQEKRQWPIELDSRFNKSFLFNLELPEGYQLAEVPKNVRIMLPDRSWEYVRMVAVSENRLTFSVKDINRREVYPAEMYPALREFLASMVTAMDEQIILKPTK